MKTLFNVAPLEGEVKRNSRNLLAYVELQNGDILIDLITLTRNGQSYYFQGKRWQRNQCCLGGDECTADDGSTIHISLLNRRQRPIWVESKECYVSPAAQKRYQLWISKQR